MPSESEIRALCRRRLEVYLRAYGGVAEARRRIGDYFDFSTTSGRTRRSATA
jgi:hypothetical protein